MEQLPGLTYGAGAVIFDDEDRVLLVRENYDRRRYGLPGGGIEPGESPEEACRREVLEETLMQAEVVHLVGRYHYFSEAGREGWRFYFRCTARGRPQVPATGEISEIGWFDPLALPRPLTVTGPVAIADAVAGHVGIERVIDLRR